MPKRKRFCLNCQENHYKTCLEARKRTRSSKHQRLESKPRDRAVKPALSQKQRNMCTDVCTVHGNEVIKFFCRKHRTVVCGDCVTLSHRNCQTDYIPDVCTDVTKTNEFKKTLRDVTEKIRKSNDFSEEANTFIIATRRNIADMIKQIEEFQNRMNEKLKDLKMAESAFEQHVDEAVSEINRISSELKTMKMNLERSQTTGQDAQAFTTMKQAQSGMKALDILSVQDKLLTEIRTYKFEPGEALVDMLSRPDGQVYSLTHGKDINARSEADKSTCDIIGCAILLSGKLVVSDWNNDKVKIVGVKKQSVVEEYALPTNPFDVAVLPHDQIAVALPLSREIQILKTRGKLATLRTFRVNRDCCGIAYHQNLLYVLCQHPNSVLVMDMQGTVHSDILLESALNETYKFPLLQQMYISDWGSDIVVSLTLQGEVTAVYKNDELKSPQGITLKEDGSLLVCCRDNGTIHHISADLTQGHKVAEGIKGASSICYDSERKTVYAGSGNCDHIYMFS